jgi:hypothetical protein
VPVTWPKGSVPALYAGSTVISQTVSKGYEEESNDIQFSDKAF